MESFEFGRFGCRAGKVHLHAGDPAHVQVAIVKAHSHPSDVFPSHHRHGWTPGHATILRNVNTNRSDHVGYALCQHGHEIVVVTSHSERVAEQWISHRPLSGSREDGKGCGALGGDGPDTQLVGARFHTREEGLCDRVRGGRDPCGAPRFSIVGRYGLIMAGILGGEYYHTASTYTHRRPHGTA